MAGIETGGAATLARGDHLPTTRLVESPGSAGHTVPDHSRDALVIVCLPAAHDGWTGYLKELESALDEIQHWYSRVVVLVAGDAGEVGRVRALVPRLTVVREEVPILRNRLAVGGELAVLVVVDRYGQVYDVRSAARAEELPNVREVEEWVKYLATQCPECGVIDEPGYGEWALE